MLETVTVKNFRCFTELTVGPFSRVNLLVGGNSTGKTALLEALWLWSKPYDHSVFDEIRRNRDIPESSEISEWSGSMFPIGLPTETNVRISAVSAGHEAQIEFFVASQQRFAEPDLAQFRNEFRSFYGGQFPNRMRYPVIISTYKSDLIKKPQQGIFLAPTMPEQVFGAI